MTLHIMVRVGAERFGFPAAAVEEALDAPAIEWVPSVPGGMLGQLQHRGRMIGAWDAGRFFRLAAPASGGAALVLRDGERRVALVVDDVTEMAHVEPADLRAAPLGSDPDGVLAGVAFQRSDGSRRALVSVVNVDALTAQMSARRTLVNGVAP